MAHVPSPISAPIVATPAILRGRGLSTAPTNTCATRVTSSGCVEKRSCRECLSPNLAQGGLLCYLDAAKGECGTFDDLPVEIRDLATATTNATAQGETLAQKRIYGSTGGQRYCSAADTACSLCATVADLPGFVPSAAQARKMSEDRKLCYGSGGCICATVCESAAWVDAAGHRCETSSSSLPPFITPSPQSRNIQSRLLTAIGFFVALQVLLTAYLCYRKRQLRRRRQAANGPYNNPQVLTTASRLQLPGWMAWQRELRANERKGEGSFVNLDLVVPSSASSSCRGPHEHPAMSTTLMTVSSDASSSDGLHTPLAPNGP